jgi:hypothetical protein
MRIHWWTHGWQECDDCQGLTWITDPWGCFSCYNTGRLPYERRWLQWLRGARYYTQKLVRDLRA